MAATHCTEYSALTSGKIVLYKHKMRISSRLMERQMRNVGACVRLIVIALYS